MNLRTIEFDVIDVPTGKSISIRFQMTQDPWIARTSEVTVILINAKLQSQTVDLFLRKRETRFGWKISPVRPNLEMDRLNKGLRSPRGPSFRWEIARNRAEVCHKHPARALANNHPHSHRYTRHPDNHHSPPNRPSA